VSNADRDALLARASRWIELNECPLPLDLAADLMAAGIDVDAVESRLLHGD